MSTADPTNNNMIMAEGRYLRMIRRGRWEFVERNNATGAVVVVAVTSEGELVLTEQYRIPMGCSVIELPAGLVGDVPGESDDPAETARRELLEETGYAAETIEYLTHGPPSAGLSNEVVTLMRASGLRRVGEGGGVGGEEIGVHVVALDGVDNWLGERMAAGVQVDPKVFAGLYFTRQSRA